MMNDTYVTVVGNVVENPRYLATASGAHLASFRLASTSRRYDRQEGRWRDGDTLFLNVACWRWLGDNVAASVKKGDPLVVSGRLRMRSYTAKDGHKRISPEIEAHNVGHDLARGVAYFQKPQRLKPVPAGSTPDELSAQWETSTDATEDPVALDGDEAMESTPTEQAQPSEAIQTETSTPEDVPGSRESLGMKDDQLLAREEAAA